MTSSTLKLHEYKNITYLRFDQQMKLQKTPFFASGHRNITYLRLDQPRKKAWAVTIY